MDCISNGVSKCKWCPGSFQCDPNLDEFTCLNDVCNFNGAKLLYSETSDKRHLQPTEHRQ